MRTTLALSGETPTTELFEEFDHIGLVRSEYLFRHEELYPSTASAYPVLYNYLVSVCEGARDASVWFRTLEVTTREANTLDGVEEQIFDEPFPLMACAVSVARWPTPPRWTPS